MSVSPPHPVAVKLDAATKARVKLLAEARKRSAHWLMREAIEQYVEREEKREAFRQDALRAWEEFQSSGEHVTAEKADQWLASVENGEDIDPPRSND